MFSTTEADWRGWDVGETEDGPVRRSRPRRAHGARSGGRAYCTGWRLSPAALPHPPATLRT
jgi:hypothetical protein